MLHLYCRCAYDQQGQLLASPAKTDGILGLSSSKISLPSQLENQGIISNVIGHCIKREAQGGGYMFLGDDYVPQWGMTWVPRQSGLTYASPLHMLLYTILKEYKYLPFTYSHIFSSS